MKFLTLQQTADYLEMAEVDQTLDQGHAIVHIGTSAAGAVFVLVNNFNGETMLTEAI